MYDKLRYLMGCVAVLAVLGINGAQAASAVVGVRAGEQAEATRFVMDLSESVDFEVFLLDNPYRVVVDFPVL